jgi:hypothetical protein
MISCIELKYVVIIFSKKETVMTMHDKFQVSNTLNQVKSDTLKKKDIQVEHGTYLAY